MEVSPEITAYRVREFAQSGRSGALRQGWPLEILDDPEIKEKARELRAEL
jgi:hypothetical protein